jgi:hypothetical protein
MILAFFRGQNIYNLIGNDNHPGDFIFTDKFFHHFISQSGSSQYFFINSWINFYNGADLAVDLNRDRNGVSLEQGFIVFWPGRVGYQVLFA